MKTRGCIINRREHQYYCPDENARTMPVDQGNSTGAVKIESIFVGAKISLQVKLYEAVVEPSKMGMKRLLARPKARSKVLASQNENRSAASALDDDDDGVNEADDDGGNEGSLVGSGDEDSQVTKKIPSPKKAPVVRKVKRVIPK